METEGNSISSKNPPSRSMFKYRGWFPADLNSEEFVMWHIFTTADKCDWLNYLSY